MTTYILLRKNKESGPFSFEELKAQEIRPDDLFWLEGQSACWLNPGEIKELKELVGQVPQLANTDHSAYLPKDDTIVPEQVAEVKSKPVQQETVITPPPVKQSASVKTFIREETDEEEPETRYSKPLDEIKAIYLKNLERQQKRKQFTIIIPPVVKKALPYAAVLVAGLIIGILINKKGKDKTESPITKQEPVTNPANTTSTEIIPEQVTQDVLPVSNTPAIVNSTQESAYQEPPVEPETSRQKKTADKKPALTEPGPDNSVSASTTDERAARNRETVPAKNEAPAEDLHSLVSVSTNDYEVGSFGGIKNLQLTLKNNSDQELEHVTAELRYYKPGDELLKTESYHFTDVPARGMQVIAVPKSARGVKVTCKLVRIGSRQP